MLGTYYNTIPKFFKQLRFKIEGYFFFCQKKQKKYNWERLFYHPISYPCCKTETDNKSWQTSLQTFYIAQKSKGFDMKYTKFIIQHQMI